MRLTIMRKLAFKKSPTKSKVWKLPNRKNWVLKQLSLNGFWKLPGEKEYDHSLVLQCDGAQTYIMFSREHRCVGFCVLCPCCIFSSRASGLLRNVGVWQGSVASEMLQESSFYVGPIKEEELRSHVVCKLWFICPLYNHPCQGETSGDKNNPSSSL